VQRHQLHAVVAGLALVFAGFQRGVRQERGKLAEPQFVVFVGALEAAGHVDQFVEVLDAGFAVAAAVFFVEVAQAAVDDGVVDLFGEGEAFFIPLPRAC
jgi:hypothetical protein